jgi:hypothetical protein
MATSEERKRLMTPRFRVSFPQVFEKQVFRGQGEDSARYACGALFSGFPVVEGQTRYSKAPAAWPEAEQKQWAELLAACNAVAVSEFKKPYGDLVKAGIYKLPFHRGEEKEYDGYGPGVVFFTMSAKKNKPEVFGKKSDGTVGRLSPEEFYPGCFARATVTPFANAQWKSLSIGMNNIQKLGEGKRLDSTRSAEDDFGHDTSVYDADGAETGDFEAGAGGGDASDFDA